MDDSRKNNEIHNSDSNHVLQDKGRITLSIVIPAYCEEGNLKIFYNELSQILQKTKLNWDNNS